MELRTFGRQVGKVRASTLFRPFPTFFFSVILSVDPYNFIYFDL